MIVHHISPATVNFLTKDYLDGYRYLPESLLRALVEGLDQRTNDDNDLMQAYANLIAIRDKASINSKI